MSSITDLSKSRYCKGVQCPKILWLDAYKPEEAENVLSEQVMHNGNLVGDLARQYFGSYALVEFSHQKEQMTQQTQEYIRQGAETIAEAAFMTDGLYCAVDLLRRNGDGWDLIEVKSSTKVSKIYLEDMAFQRHSGKARFQYAPQQQLRQKGCAGSAKAVHPGGLHGDCQSHVRCRCRKDRRDPQLHFGQ